MSLVKGMATVGGLTGVSRIAGFIRDIMTASFLGAGPVADAFVVALKLPNFFRNVFAEGAFSVSFVPLYTKTLHTEGEDGASAFAGQAFAVMTTVLTVFSTVVIALMPWLMILIAPGFEHGTLRYDLAVELSRITFPFLLLMSLSALVGGMLNAHEHFGPFASTSIFFNLTQIVVMVWGVQYFSTPGHALAWAVTISGVIQLARLLWYLRKHGIPLAIVRPKFTPQVKKLFGMMAPGIMGAGILQVNLFADIVISSNLPVGAVSAIYYADRLFQLPIGVIGIAVGTALLPLLTKALAAGKTAEANDLFNRALEYGLFMTMPAAVALMIAHHEIITVLFQRGHYTPADAARTSPALACLAFGMPAYVAVKIFSSSYWARHDTKTPVKISSCMAVVNIVVALIMTRFIDVAGIAFATGLAGWIQCYFLWRGLRGDAAARFDGRLRNRVPKIVLCASAMGAALLVVMFYMKPWFYGSQPERLMALGALTGVGGVVYFGGAHVTGLFRLGEMKKYLRRRKDADPAMLEEQSTEASIEID
jgi:putative peptidoglycan lipid II flippase